jgi:hypothetical protein
MDQKVFLFQVCVVGMLNYLAENFKMRFNNFCSHATNTDTSENPYSTENRDAPEKLQLQMTVLQYA